MVVVVRGATSIRLTWQARVAPAMAMYAALLLDVFARLSAAFVGLNLRCRGIVLVIMRRALLVFPDAALLLDVLARLSAAFVGLNLRCRGIVSSIIWRAFLIFFEVCVVAISSSSTT